MINHYIYNDYKSKIARLMNVQNIMSTGKYYYKNLPPRFIEAWKSIEESGSGLFSIEDLMRISGFTREDINELVENLYRHSLLERIERGKYCRYNYSNENAIGCFFAENGTVGYGSALNHYGLTPRFPNAIIIQTTRKRLNAIFRGVFYRFTAIKPAKYAGIETIGYGGDKFRITSLEKTLVDCFDKPDLAGEYPDLIRAFVKSGSSPEKLIEVGRVIHNRAALKRMGYIAELAGLKNLYPFCQFVKSELTNTYDLFDPSGLNAGKMVGCWKLRMNISSDDLNGLINATY